MIAIMEKELACWIDKYPIPTMVCACDDTGSFIYVKNSDGSNLLGWIDPETKQLKTSWNPNNFQKYDGKPEYFKEGWDKVYKEVGYRTQAQIKEKADAWTRQQKKEIRVLQLVMLAWFCMIPATWLFMQQFGSKWIGWAVYVYACAKILLEAKKIYFPKTNKRETPEEEKKHKMEHYYYHCERNPEGFAKLRAENFANDLREETVKEFDVLKKVI